MYTYSKKYLLISIFLINNFITNKVFDIKYLLLIVFNIVYNGHTFQISSN